MRKKFCFIQILHSNSPGNSNGLFSFYYWFFLRMLSYFFVRFFPSSTWHRTRQNPPLNPERINTESKQHRPRTKSSINSSRSSKSNRSSSNSSNSSKFRKYLRRLVRAAVATAAPSTTSTLLSTSGRGPRRRARSAGTTTRVRAARMPGRPTRRRPSAASRSTSSTWWPRTWCRSTDRSTTCDPRSE